MTIEVRWMKTVMRAYSTELRVSAQFLRRLTHFRLGIIAVQPGFGASSGLDEKRLDANRQAGEHVPSHQKASYRATVSRRESAEREGDSQRAPEGSNGRYIVPPTG